MRFRLRRAQPADVGAMLEVKQALRVGARVRGGFLLGTDAAGYQARIAAGNSWVLAADEAVVGFAVVLPDPAFRGSEVWARRDQVQWTGGWDPASVDVQRLGYFDQLAVRTDVPGARRWGLALAYRAAREHFAAHDALVATTVLEPIRNVAAVPYLRRAGGRAGGPDRRGARGHRPPRVAGVDGHPRRVRALAGAAAHPRRGLDDPRRVGGGMNAPRRAVPPQLWSDWRWQLRHQLRTVADLEGWITLTNDERAAVSATAARFRLGITPFYASLMHPTDPGCPIRRQAVPTLAELRVGPLERPDPLAEERDMPVPGLTRRYPDRVLLYTSHTCAVYCRHCTRRRKVSNPASAPLAAQLERALTWIAAHREVRDVVLSGGDPLSLGDAALDRLLGRLKAIDHVQIVRIGTRHPTTLPQRITRGLLDVLHRHRPVYLMTHFNHPTELTPEAAQGLAALHDAGSVLANQTVLLAGVNDDAAVLTELSQRLLAHRVRPYRWYHCDHSEGTGHFRTTIDRDAALLRALEVSTSGLGVPQLVVDLPGGRGKAAVGSGAARRNPDGTWVLRGRDGSEVVLR